MLLASPIFHQTRSKSAHSPGALIPTCVAPAPLQFALWSIRRCYSSDESQRPYQAYEPSGELTKILSTLNMSTLTCRFAVYQGRSLQSRDIAPRSSPPRHNLSPRQHVLVQAASLVHPMCATQVCPHQQVHHCSSPAQARSCPPQRPTAPPPGRLSRTPSGAPSGDSTSLSRESTGQRTPLLEHSRYQVPRSPLLTNMPKAWVRAATQRSSVLVICMCHVWCVHACRFHVRTCVCMRRN
jgi:hypothetical protein